MGPDRPKRRKNAWNDFQAEHKQYGWSQAQAKAAYQAQKNGQPQSSATVLAGEEGGKQEMRKKVTSSLHQEEDQQRDEARATTSRQKLSKSKSKAKDWLLEKMGGVTVVQKHPPNSIATTTQRCAAPASSSYASACTVMQHGSAASDMPCSTWEQAYSTSTAQPPPLRSSFSFPHDQAPHSLHARSMHKGSSSSSSSWVGGSKRKSGFKVILSKFRQVLGGSLPKPAESAATTAEAGAGAAYLVQGLAPASRPTLLAGKHTQLRESEPEACSSAGRALHPHSSVPNHSLQPMQHAAGLQHKAVRGGGDTSAPFLHKTHPASADHHQQPDPATPPPHSLHHRHHQQQQQQQQWEQQGAQHHQRHQHHQQQHWEQQGEQHHQLHQQGEQHWEQHHQRHQQGEQHHITPVPRRYQDPLQDQDLKEATSPFRPLPAAPARPRSVFEGSRAQRVHLQHLHNLLDQGDPEHLAQSRAAAAAVATQEHRNSGAAGHMAEHTPHKRSADREDDVVRPAHTAAAAAVVVAAREAAPKHIAHRQRAAYSHDDVEVLAPAALQQDSGGASAKLHDRKAAGCPAQERGMRRADDQLVAKGRKKPSEHWKGSKPDPKVACLPQFVPYSNDGNLRVRAREHIPDNHDRYFCGFTNWVEVSHGLLVSRVRRAIPKEPGLYEWGAMPPDSTNGRVWAYYLGQSGDLRGKVRNNEGLRSRFYKYANMNIPWLGPFSETCSLKAGIFRELQRKGFKLYYRWCTCLEPEKRETEILRDIDYAANNRKNNEQRQPFFEAGTLADFPVIVAT